MFYMYLDGTLTNHYSGLLPLVGDLNTLGRFHTVEIFDDSLKILAF